jgi:hypothetical protein
VTSWTAAAALVDVEVSDSAGTRVCQQVFDGQAFGAGQTRSYPVTCTLPAGAASGLYVAKIGVFSPGWSTLYSWNDRAAYFLYIAAP